MTPEVVNASAIKAVPIVSSTPTIMPTRRLMTATSHQQDRNAILSAEFQLMLHVARARYKLALLNPVRLMMAGTVSPDSQRPYLFRLVISELTLTAETSVHLAFSPDVVLELGNHRPCLARCFSSPTLSRKPSVLCAPCQVRPPACRQRIAPQIREAAGLCMSLNSAPLRRRSPKALIVDFAPKGARVSPLLARARNRPARITRNHHASMAR